jgi:hypothetical protein
LGSEVIEKMRPLPTNLVSALTEFSGEIEEKRDI